MKPSSSKALGEWNVVQATLRQVSSKLGVPRPTIRVTNAWEAKQKAGELAVGLFLMLFGSRYNYNLLLLVVSQFFGGFITRFSKETPCQEAL